MIRTRLVKLDLAEFVLLGYFPDSSICDSSCWDDTGQNNKMRYIQLIKKYQIAGYKYYW